MLPLNESSLQRPANRGPVSPRGVPRSEPNAVPDGRPGEGARVPAEAGGGSGGQPRFRFEKLGVWQDARLLHRQGLEVFDRIRAAGQSELAARLQQEVLRISGTIAVGAVRGSDHGFDSYLEEAQEGLLRLASDLHVCVDAAWLSSAEAEPLWDRVDRLGGRIHALRRSFTSRSDRDSGPRGSTS